MEGTTTGSFNELTFLNGLVLDPKQQTELIEQYGGLTALGGPDTAPHCAAAWAHALQRAVPVGQAGRRAPGRHARPDGRRVAGAAASPSTEMRSQFTHVIDIGADRPRGGGHPRARAGRRHRPGADGRNELPLHARRRAGARAAHDAVLRDVRRARHVPRGLVGGLATRPSALGPVAETIARMGPEADWDPDRDVGWELYDLRSDFSQARDVAADHPEKVQELQELWWKEAERNRVLPLMAGFSVMYGILPPMPTQTRFPFDGRRRQHPVGHGAADLRPLVRDRGRPRDPRGRRRGRDRRDGRLHRRLRALGGLRRDPAPHLLAARRGDLQAGGHHAASRPARSR